jgi:hypothetical protein
MNNEAFTETTYGDTRGWPPQFRRWWLDAHGTKMAPLGIRTEESKHRDDQGDPLTSRVALLGCCQIYLRSVISRAENDNV